MAWQADIQPDYSMPKFGVWDITIDAVCMDVGDTVLYDLEDRQALGIISRLKHRTQRRLEEIERQEARLMALLEPTSHTIAEHNATMAASKRWSEEVFPRTLEIALHKAGIEAK